MGKGFISNRFSLFDNCITHPGTASANIHINCEQSQLLITLPLHWETDRILKNPVISGVIINKTSPHLFR